MGVPEGASFEAVEKAYATLMALNQERFEAERQAKYFMPGPEQRLLTKDIEKFLILSFDILKSQHELKNKEADLQALIDKHRAELTNE